MGNSLWGNLDDLKCEIKNPKSILEEQAEYLKDDLDGLVRCNISRGSVRTEWQGFYNDRGVDCSFAYSFKLISDYVEKYEYEVFKIIYGIKMYPLAMTFESDICKELDGRFVTEDDDTIFVENEEKLLEVLQAIFLSNEVRQVLKGLLSLAKKEKESSDCPFF